VTLEPAWWEKPQPTISGGGGIDLGPLIDTFIILPVTFLGRGLWQVARRPQLMLGTGTLTTGVFFVPQGLLTFGLGGLCMAPAVWAAVHHESFRQVGCTAVRDRWRRSTVYQRIWDQAMVGCGLMKRKDATALIPEIKGVSGSEFFDHVTVQMLPGQEHGMFYDASKKLAATFGSDACRVRRVPRRKRQRGTRLRLDFQRKDALADVIPPYPIPIDEPVDLEAVPMGRTEYGDQWLLNLVGTHIVIGGATGSGKASVLWSMMRGIAPAIRDGLVEVWAFDPKGGMELKHGRPMFTRYWGENADIPDMAKGLADLREVVKARSVKHAEAMSRKHEPSVEDPLIICLIDELADITQFPDKKVRDPMISDIEFGLRRARSVGVTYVMALQKVAKTGTIPFRDLIPDGIALRLDEDWMIDGILGPGAYKRGAACHEIPGKPGPGQSLDGRGVAYITQMGDPEPLRVRASYPTDDDLAEMVAEYPAFKRPGNDEQEVDDGSGEPGTDG
jgi:S-DNA-T family DNA segregation ATPase FtsK/SpoIIIE